MASAIRDAARRLLPKEWWDGLRRLKRGGDLSSPIAMGRLRGLKARGFVPTTVLDVGAAHGDWTASCLRIFPDAEYVLVEPLPEYGAQLAKLAAHPHVDYVAAAAGSSEATLPLLVPDEPGGSSFLPASRAGDGSFKRSIDFPILTLDSLRLPSGSTLLKLDVQGYELQVLAGAQRTLAQVEVLIAECSLYPFQRDLPLVHDVIDRVVDLGFQLYDRADEVRRPSNMLAQIDLVFVAQRSQLIASSEWR
jgi:FkbM family methyltransferase